MDFSRGGNLSTSISTEKAIKWLLTSVKWLLPPLSLLSLSLLIIILNHMMWLYYWIKWLCYSILTVLLNHVTVLFNQVTVQLNHVTTPLNHVPVIWNHVPLLLNWPLQKSAVRSTWPYRTGSSTQVGWSPLFYGHRKFDTASPRLRLDPSHRCCHRLQMSPSGNPWRQSYDASLLKNWISYPSEQNLEWELNRKIIEKNPPKQNLALST